MKTLVAPLTEEEVNSTLLANGHFKSKRMKIFSLMNWEYQNKIRKLAEIQLREWLTRGVPQEHWVILETLYPVLISKFNLQQPLSLNPEINRTSEELENTANQLDTNVRNRVKINYYKLLSYYCFKQSSSEDAMETTEIVNLENICDDNVIFHYVNSIEVYWFSPS